jgi:TAT (twin-arginine translocation) pathway signal sequence
MNSLSRESKNNKNRRQFLKHGMVAAGAATLGTGLLATGVPVLAEQEKDRNGKLSKGDAAILRFLAAAEILETDLWVQYNELGGIQDNEVPGGSGSSL